MKYVCNNGHEWDLTISLGVARRLADKKTIDLVNIQKFQDIAQALINPITALDILWECVRPQAEKLSVSQSEFEDSLGLDLQEVFTRLQESAVAFILALEPNTGTALKNALGQMKTIITKKADALTELMDSDKIQKGADREIEKMVTEMDKELDKLLK